MLFSVRLTNRKTNEWRLFRVYAHCSRIYSYVYIYQCRHEFKLDRKIIHLTNCTELKEWEGWKGFLAHRNLGGVKDGIRYQVSGFLAYQIFLVWWGTYKRKQEGILFMAVSTVSFLWSLTRIWSDPELFLAWINWNPDLKEKTSKL